ncbi:cytochrome P450 [Nocardioides sp. W3-2-3]|uniref:cytochrome P450 n=1 Tax=Nocardioides convexus TaxID=2712224 RepID=UPI002418169C|nr:cytochrome P450 [Nocardioides convexus]NHA01439.1 cytochrome P450 [Nocardioides convexus]
MPAFLGHALRGYRGMVAEVATDEAEGWTEGVPFRALERMNALTLEVILRVVFGVTDEERLARLRPAVNRTVEINPAVLLGWAYPRLQKLGPWRRTVENQVETRQADVCRDPRASYGHRPRRPHRCPLSAAGRHRPRGAGQRAGRHRACATRLVTLLLAGHETTASALSWALVEIGRSADLLARTQHAADQGDDAWLEAVLKESMRLHPIIPMVVRTLMAPATVGGWDLPAGTTVGPSIILSHQQESNFADPDVFRPERFLGKDTPALNVWIPFGGGVRRCIGAGFSLMEGVEVLREVFRRYDVEAVGREVPQVRNITSVPRRGARIRVARRA